MRLARSKVLNSCKAEMLIRDKPLRVSRTAGSETETPLSLNKLENRTILSVNPSAVGRGIPFSHGA